MNSWVLLSIMFLIGCTHGGVQLQSYQSTMKQYYMTISLFFRTLSISGPGNNLFSTKPSVTFSISSGCTNPTWHPSLLLCVLFSKFFSFCLRYSSLFSMERLLPEWMPPALWVLKELSLLQGCVASPTFFEIPFWSIHEPFLLRFSLTCKRWSVSPLGQAARCLILLSVFLMHSMQLLVVRLHYFKCLMGKYCCGPLPFYLVCCCSWLWRLTHFACREKLLKDDCVFFAINKNIAWSAFLMFFCFVLFFLSFS